MRLKCTLCILVLGFVAFTGCGDPMTKLRTRSAFDLKCPEDQLALKELTACGAWTFGTCTVGVTGCGRQATYVDRQNGSGDWIMNNTAEPGPASR